MSDTELKTVVEYSVDLNNAEAPPALPKGQYPFEIRTAEVAQGPKGDWYKLGLYFAPEVYPVDVAADLPADGMIVPGPYVSAADTVKDRFKVRKLLEALGLKLSNKVDVNNFIGATGTAETTVEMFEGVPQTRVVKIVAN